MATTTVTCKHCGNGFCWNDQWPDDLKRCPLCGILVDAPLSSVMGETIEGVKVDSPKIPTEELTELALL